MKINKTWAVYAHLSHISGQENKQKAIRYVDYILRANECIASYSADKSKDEKDKWRELLSREERINSRMQSRIIVPLPNSLTQQQFQEFAYAINDFFKQYGGVHFLVALHRGQKKDYHNLHAHIVYSDRDVSTGRKLRDMLGRFFLLNLKSTIAEFLHTIQTNVRANQDSVSIRLDRIRYNRFLRGEDMNHDHLFRAWVELRKRKHCVHDDNELRELLLSKKLSNERNQEVMIMKCGNKQGGTVIQVKKIDIDGNVIEVFYVGENELTHLRRAVAVGVDNHAYRVKREGEKVAEWIVSTRNKKNLIKKLRASKEIEEIQATHNIEEQHPGLSMNDLSEKYQEFAHDTETFYRP